MENVSDAVCLVIQYVMFSTVSASPRVTEMEAGSHVTLSCSLHTDDNCGESVRDKGVRLSWVDEGGKELKTTNHGSRTEAVCNVTLTETLRDQSSHNKAIWRWRCQLTAGSVNVSTAYTITEKG